jgi:hypothetical protein
LVCRLAARPVATYVSFVGGHRKRFAMKRLAFAVAVLALGFAASTPARADYAVVRLDDGWCKIWWDSADNPWGAGWTKIAFGLPDWLAASAALDAARSQGACR